MRRTADPPLLVTSNQSTPIKNTFGRNTVLFFAYDKILFSVVFNVVRAVYKFDFRLVTYKMS